MCAGLDALRRSVSCRTGSEYLASVTSRDPYKFMTKSTYSCGEEAALLCQFQAIRNSYDPLLNGSWIPADHSLALEESLMSRASDRSWALVMVR